MSIYEKLESIQRNACLVLLVQNQVPLKKNFSFIITSVTTLIQKTRDVLQHIQKPKFPIPF